MIVVGDEIVGVVFVVFGFGVNLCVFGLWCVDFVEVD